MKLWPWSKREPERRESIPFTDAVVAALAAQAGGTAIRGRRWRHRGARGRCSALQSSLCRGATIFDPPEAATVLNPPCMAFLARNLIRRGEDVHQIMVEGGMVRLQPIGSWDVRGGPREREWWYRCDRFGPSGNLTELAPAAAVLHCRYAIDSARPWYGISPLGWARSTGTLAANLDLLRSDQRSSARKRAARSGT